MFCVFYVVSERSPKKCPISGSPAIYQSIWGSLRSSAVKEWRNNGGGETKVCSGIQEKALLLLPDLY